MRRSFITLVGLAAICSGCGETEEGVPMVHAMDSVAARTGPGSSGEAGMSFVPFSAMPERTTEASTDEVEDPVPSATGDDGTKPDTPDSFAIEERSAFRTTPDRHDSPLRVFGWVSYDLERQCGIPSSGSCYPIKERKILNNYAGSAFSRMKNSIRGGSLKQYCNTPPYDTVAKCNKEKKKFLRQALRQMLNQFHSEKHTFIHSGIGDALGSRTWNWKYFREHLFEITDVEWSNYLNGVGGCISLNPAYGDHGTGHVFTNKQCQSFYGTY